jgi:uncharacterized protein with FMN-binding domain
MRRIVLAVMTTISSLTLLFSYHTSRNEPAAQAEQASSSSGGGSGQAQASYAGDVVQTRWGPVQVEIVVENARITSSTVLQVPSENGRDREINGYAVPILNSEVVDAQSAGIDSVSGATVTSEGYRTSLQSAIDRANL